MPQMREERNNAGLGRSASEIEYFVPRPSLSRVPFLPIKEEAREREKRHGERD